ncbi:hypothetical protein JXL21_02330 [Candidatus Bathyarchaeota archaeon]|nr:hypothetical protein [Candidatus Bathyarchaeota archaeon]
MILTDTSIEEVYQKVRKFIKRKSWFQWLASTGHIWVQCEIKEEHSPNFISFIYIKNNSNYVYAPINAEIIVHLTNLSDSVKVDIEMIPRNRPEYSWIPYTSRHPVSFPDIDINKVRIWWVDFIRDFWSGLTEITTEHYQRLYPENELEERKKFESYFDNQFKQMVIVGVSSIIIMILIILFMKYLLNR